MPLIDEFDSLLPLVTMNGAGELFPDPSVHSFFIATLAGTSQFLPNGSTDQPGTTTLAGTSGVDFFGRLNSDPNRLGKATLAGVGILHPNPFFRMSGKLIIHGQATFSARGRIAGGDASECRIFLTIADPIDNGFSATYSARLTADGTEYKIKGYEYSEGRANAGVSLNLTLQKPNQRDAILAATSIKFELYLNGSWETVFETGSIGGAGFSFAWSAGKPSNQLSISTNAPIDAALGKSPPLNATVYDPYREDIDASQYKNILDENGHIYGHDLVQFPGMTLSTLLRHVFVTKLGFSHVITTLPKYQVSRADFSMTGTYLDGLSGILGNYEPLVFVKGNDIHLLDSTVRLPAGFVPSVILDHTKYLNAQFQETRLNADGYLAQYIEQNTEFDYQQTRDVIIPTSSSGSPGSADYLETDISQTFTDYYKLSNPAAPIRTEKTSEVVTVSGMVRNSFGSLSFREISTTTETISFDNKMRLTEITKDTIALIPNVTAGIPFVFITDFVRSERQTFEYAPDIFDPKREYLSEMVKKVSALVATETNPDKKNVGDTFKQEFFDCWRAGNFTDTMTIATESVQEITERAQQTRKGQIEVRQQTINFLTNPPATINQVTDGRTGDITQNANNGSTAEIIVYRDGLTSRAGAKLVPISIGPLPLVFGIPLLKRKLKFQNRRRGAVTLKGLTLSIVRGSSFRLLDQDGVSAGDYLVEGRSIAGSNLGTREQTTRQTLEVIQI